jgi:hypothetical protein
MYAVLVGLPQFPLVRRLLGLPAAWFEMSSSDSLVVLNGTPVHSVHAVGS